MNNYQILVVDDEWNMRNLLRVYLKKEGFEVREARDGGEALALIEQHSFDLIILDIMMPGMDGWDVCAKVRQNHQVPILMLTARTDTKDKVHGLNLGADDYLVKPFEPEELIARVQALLRRSNLPDESQQVVKSITVEGMTIDPEARQVIVQEQQVILTPKEFDLLYKLAEHSRRVFSREVLLNQVWGDDYFGDLRTVDTHVKKVREKTRKAGLAYNPIQTVWGVGYKFKELDRSR